MVLQVSDRLNSFNQISFEGRGHARNLDCKKVGHVSVVGSSGVPLVLRLLILSGCGSLAFSI